MVADVVGDVRTEWDDLEVSRTGEFQCGLGKSGCDAIPFDFRGHLCVDEEKPVACSPLMKLVWSPTFVSKWPASRHGDYRAKDRFP
jgi:hypothetical protein